MTKTTKSYTEMLKEELLLVARRLGLTNLSRLRKDEILDLVRRATATKAKKTAKAKTAKATKTSSAKKAKAPTVNKAKTAKIAKTTKTTAAKAKTAKVANTTKTTATKAKTSKTTSVNKAKTAKATKTSSAKKAKDATPARTRIRPSKAKAAEAAKVTAARAAASNKSKPAKQSAATKPSMASSRAANPTANAARARTSGTHLRPSPLGPVSHQASAMASKYEAGRTGESADLQRLDSGLPELPESYGDNRIVLMPRDISWLFTYWDLTDEYKDAARSAGGNVLALRLYDVTGLDFNGTNSHGMYEHECTEWARSWYIPTPTPDRDYVVEIGYRGADQWFPLARSNKVSVPSDQPSTWIKDDFISINFDEDLQQVHDRFTAPAPTSSHAAAAPPQSLAVPEQTIFEDGELRITVGGALLSPSGGPAWPPFSFTAQEGPGYTLPSSQSFIPGSLGYPSSYEFMTGSISHLPSSSNLVGGGAFQLPSSPDFLGVIPLDRLMGPKPGADRGDSAWIDQPGDSEGRGETPLMVTTMEMVISGRSVPGASLRIAGRPIPLGPDGCFSLRITVPEGTRELPIEARAHATGEVQRVTLHLGRESE